MRRRETPPDLESLEIIVTSRLRLRPAAAGDVEAIFAYASNQNVCRFMGWPRHRTIEDSHRFLRTLAPGWEGGDRLSWVIEEPAGVVGMIAAELGYSGAGLGYVLAEEVWGRGYATEALEAVCSALFAATEVATLWAMCLPENPASARVLTKCGFRHERLLRGYFVCPNLGPEKHDIRLYARRRNGR
jgi:ribosomal-protein-alanine N-acetyltransferase